MSRYVPRTPPPSDNPEDLRTYLLEEFDRISEAVESLKDLRMEVRTRPPRRPRDGDISFADGVEWNPGDGRGTYEYKDGNWHKL